MGKNIHDLAMRDPALAALIGKLGSDFGADRGDDFGVDLPTSAFGLDISPATQIHPAAALMAQQIAPAAQNPQAHAIVAQHLSAQQVSQQRRRLLSPNEGSSITVERYAFAIDASITLGTATAISLSGQPDTYFRPQRVMMNSPAPGFVTISSGRVANVNFTVGSTTDSWFWNANAVGTMLDLPLMSPAHKATIQGNYTGTVPTPLSGTGAFTFVTQFEGPASVAG
jgi:hypothetical protein